MGSPRWGKTLYSIFFFIYSEPPQYYMTQPWSLLLLMLVVTLQKDAENVHGVFRAGKVSGGMSGDVKWNANGNGVCIDRSF